MGKGNNVQSGIDRSHLLYCDKWVDVIFYLARPSSTCPWVWEVMESPLEAAGARWTEWSP